MSTTTLPRRMPKTNAGLGRVFFPRPLRDDVDLKNIAEIVDRLAVLDDRTQDQTDYLEVLATLIEAYESNRHPFDVSHITALDALKFLMKENGMSGSDLGRLLGSRQLGSAILRGDRALSKAHIKRLAEHFHIEPGLLLS